MLQKINHLNKLLNEGIWVFLTQISSILLNIILISIVASKLNVSQYGSLALIMTIQAFFSLIFYGTINNGVLRYSSICNQLNKNSNFVNIVIKISLIIGTLLTIIGFALTIFFYLVGFKNYVQPFNVVLITSILIGTIDFLTSVILSLRKRKILFIIKTLEGIIKILVLYFATLSNYLSVLYIYLITSIIICLTILAYFKKHLSKFSLSYTKFDHYWIKKIYRYSSPFLYWAIFVWAQQNSLKWALELIVSRRELGLYNALSQIAYTPVIILFGVILNLITPIIYEKINPSLLNNESKRILNHILKFSTVSLFLIVFGAIILVPSSNYIVGLIFPIEYQEVSRFLPFVFVAGGLYSTGNILANIPFSINSPKILLKPNIYSSIIGISLSFVLVYFFGLSGGILALLLHGLLYYFLVVLSVKGFLSSLIFQKSVLLK